MNAVFADRNIQNMLVNRTVRIVAQTADSFRTGFELYRARLDKGYSLTGRARS